LDIYGRPTYSLSSVKQRIKDPSTRIVTRAALRNAVSLGYASDDDIVQRVLNLHEAEIHKTMESNTHNLWQDVYITQDGNQKIYIKLQLSPDKSKGVIIQFKKSDT